MNISSEETLANSQPITLDAALITEALQSALVYIHLRSSKQAIRLPSVEGAFPDAVFLPPLPVVLDSSILRKDIPYACRNDQRTVLINAANSQLLRLF